MIYFYFLCLYQSSGKRVKIGRNCYDRVTVAKFLRAASSYKRKSFISHFRLSRLHILSRRDLFNIGQMPLRFQNLKESLVRHPARDLYQLHWRITYIFSHEISPKIHITQEDDFPSIILPRTSTEIGRIVAEVLDTSAGNNDA